MEAVPETPPPARIAVLTIIAIVLAASIVSVWYAGQAPEPASGCIPGPVIAYHNDSLTPLLLANSPYQGTGSGTVPTLNHTWNVTLGGPDSNGSTWGYFEHIDWTLRAGQGGGTGSDCDRMVYLTQKDDWSATIFQLSNGSIVYFVNDSEQPASIELNWSNGPTYLYSQFYRATSVLSTCATNTSVQTSRSDHITVGIGFSYGGTNHTVTTTINIDTSYRYVFPANTGVWLIDNLSAPGGPGGGWAFSFLRGCT